MSSQYKEHNARTLTTTRPWSCRIHTLFREMWKTAAQCFDEAGLRSGNRVLDYGCGEMPYLPLLLDRGCEVIGADFPGNPNAAIFLNTEAQLDPQLTGQFDAVLSTQVLEHVGNPHKYLSEAHRVLKPDGAFILSTHGLYPYHADPADYWRWTHEGLKLELLRSGFAIKHMYPVFTIHQTVLQLFQDITRGKLPGLLRNLYTSLCQMTISAIGKLHRASQQKDALTYFIIAAKQPLSGDKTNGAKVCINEQ